MVASIFIIVVSAVLFGYWFRYTCILMLEAKPAKDYSSEVATENRLGFHRVQRELETSGSPDLAELHESLERDYRVVTMLLKQVSDLSVAGTTFEEALMRADFWLMKACYRVSRRFSEARAQIVLREMCQIVDQLANTFGERVIAASTTE